MNIARFSVARPVFTIMLVLIVLILGGVALVRLPIDLMPDITNPTFTISCIYENASPEEIETLVTRPIEQALAAVPGVEEVNSSSVEGRANVRVTFAWGTDLDAAANDIRDRLDRVAPRLPDEAERPVLRKFDMASFPILFLGVSSELSDIQLRRVVEDQIQYRIERVPGVAAVDIWGGLQREVHVNLLPEKVKALGLPLDQVLQKIRDANINIPAGTIDRGNLEITVRTPGEYTDLEQLRGCVVAVRDGTPIRLDQVAEVVDTHQKQNSRIRINGKNGLRLAVNKQSGRNTVEVAKGVLEEIERVNLDMPMLRVTSIVDTSDYIRRSISNVGSAAMYGGVLAIGVLLVFLRNIRSTIVIATAIPISIVATFALIYFRGYTLNLMTLGGLALGVGMLLDNSIVVLENIFRLRTEKGQGVREAAIHGADEVGAAVVASTLTTVVVFLPLVFMRGMSGVMFKQLAAVIGFALLCSLAVALTLVPMLTARVLPANVIGGRSRRGLIHRLFELTGKPLAALENGYKSALAWSLDHRGLIVLILAAALGGSLYLGRYVGRELLPATDEGQVRIAVEMQVGTRMAVLDQTFAQIEDIINKSVPEAERRNVIVSVGGGGWGGGGGHTGDVNIMLVPMAQRRRSSEQVAADLRKKLSGVAGCTIRCNASQGLIGRIMPGGGAERVRLDIRGHDIPAADELAKRVKALVEGVEGVTDTRLSRESGVPENLIMIDRPKASDLNLTVSAVATCLQTILSGTQAGYYREGGNEYLIRVKVKDADRSDLRAVLDLTLTNTRGEPVVLRNVVAIQPRSGPVRVERKDQERIVTVSANISERDMGSIMADIQARLPQLAVPEGFAITFAGDYEEQQKSFRELLLSCVLALVLVYMVMACQYESLRDPLIVMFSVPLAVIGVLLVLFFTRTTFNIQSYIGCIMLGGIVVNNAILLVDHTNLLRRRDKMSVREAIKEAGRRRLRPILMTALTTILGLLPLALGLGEGGEAQAPMARVVIGGLSSSALITLVVVPVVYSFFEREKDKAHA